ncbi:MAG: nucleotidyl transferase AbiEii/AbiGii toxin family protein [Bacteroidota bacterium]
MLQYRSVYPETLELLKELMQVPSLQNFQLVGGTALALQLGHRISVDLDLFSEKEFEKEAILRDVRSLGKVESIHPELLMLMINEVKVDIVHYPYPFIYPIEEIEGIRLASVKDIIAMKLSAIANRGAKKDFFDVCMLLDQYSLKEMLQFFAEKFPGINHFHVIKSLTYFEDAEEDAPPLMLTDLKWINVKEIIEGEVESFLKK